MRVLLKKKQLKALDFMDSRNLGNVVMPTGSGKSLLIFHNLLKKYGLTIL